MTGFLKHEIGRLNEPPNKIIISKMFQNVNYFPCWMNIFSCLHKIRLKTLGIIAACKPDAGVLSYSQKG